MSLTNALVERATQLMLPDSEVGGRANAKASFQERMKAVLDARAKASKVSDKEADEFMRAVQGNLSGPEAKAWAAALVETIDVFIWPTYWATSFFKLVSLAQDEWPIINTHIEQRELKAYWQGEVGGKGMPKSATLEQDVPQQQLLKRYITMAKRYPLFDLQTGAMDVAGRRKKAEWAIAKAMEQKLHNDSKTLLETCFGTSGLRARMKFHSDVVQANLPDSNSWNFTTSANPVGAAVGTANKITLEKLKIIFGQYFDLFADDVEPDGVALKPVTIYCSTKNKPDFYDFADKVGLLDLTGGSPARAKVEVNDPASILPESMRDEIWQSGTLSKMLGHPINLVPKNIIAQGTLYIASNKPVGWIWEKNLPGMSGVHVNADSDELREQGAAEVWMEKAIAQAVVAPYYHHALKVTL